MQPETAKRSSSPCRRQVSADVQAKAELIPRRHRVRGITHRKSRVLRNMQEILRERETEERSENVVSLVRCENETGKA